jgi:hypothetical protein
MRAHHSFPKPWGLCNADDRPAIRPICVIAIQPARGGLLVHRAGDAGVVIGIEARALECKSSCYRQPNCFKRLSM